jgi:hypothetical protein
MIMILTKIKKAALDEEEYVDEVAGEKVDDEVAGEKVGEVADEVKKVVGEVEEDNYIKF